MEEGLEDGAEDGEDGGDEGGEGVGKAGHCEVALRERGRIVWGVE